MPDQPWVPMTMRSAAWAWCTICSLGFAKPGPTNPFGHPSSFGMPGAGGSFGFADPNAGIGYGYVLNRMDTYFMDPRAMALRSALYRSIGEPDPYRE
jgi:CubicO group peptidase (beta-lactamase class C family)